MTTHASQKVSEKGGSRILKWALQKVLRRVLRRCLPLGFDGKEGLRRGS